MLATLRSDMLRLSVLTVVALTGMGLTGCAAAGRHVAELYSVALIRAQESRDLSRVRQDTRDEMAQQREEARRIAAERDIEQARMAAQRAQLEMEFCRANQEAQQQQLQRNIRESVESRVAFNVVQGLEVGELEVDVEELKGLLEQREKQPPQPQQEAQKEPCECCDRPCGCKPGLIRRHCPHCRIKPCEAELNCGGPAALAQLEQQPQRQPLRPAEIPLKLPVRLTFGMQNPSLEQARIRREPLISQPQLEGKPCDHPCPQGAVPCDDRRGAAQSQSLPTHPVFVEPQNPAVPAEESPPTPEPDNSEAVWRPLSEPIQKVHADRLSFAGFGATWEISDVGRTYEHRRTTR